VITAGTADDGLQNEEIRKRGSVRKQQENNKKSNSMEQCPFADTNNRSADQ
jgi:hypothetical protein